MSSLRRGASSQHEAQWVRAYGDRRDDGVVQLSFVLPLAPSEIAREAARKYAEQHGLVEPLVAAMEEAAEGFAYFVVYGRSRHAVDIASLDVAEIPKSKLSKGEIEAWIEEGMGRKVVIVGACTGSDAHTVGIDAVLNYKGYAGHKGLESYKCFEVHNLGAQVENESLIARGAALGADAILVSQVITQRNCHKDNARELIEMLERAGSRARFLMLLGGPRIDHKLALELGFDGGFGPGTTPGEVAAFVAVRLCSGAPRDAQDEGLSSR